MQKVSVQKSVESILIRKEVVQKHKELHHTQKDRKLLHFADLFEDKFVRQGHDEDRSIEDSLSIAWDLIATLDADQITRISRKYIEKYLPKKE